jgi:hypothetical protein
MEGHPARPPAPANDPGPEQAPASCPAREQVRAGGLGRGCVQDHCRSAATGRDPNSGNTQEQPHWDMSTGHATASDAEAPADVRHSCSVSRSPPGRLKAPPSLVARTSLLSPGDAAPRRLARALLSPGGAAPLRLAHCCPLRSSRLGNHFIMGHGRAGRHRVSRPRRRRRSFGMRTGRGPRRLRRAAWVSVRTRPVISRITAHAA